MSDLRPAKWPIIPGRIVMVRDFRYHLPRYRRGVLKRVGECDLMVLLDGLKTPRWYSWQNVFVGESEEYAREYFKPRKRRDSSGGDETSQSNLSLQF